MTYKRFEVRQISIAIFSRMTTPWASSFRKVAWPKRSGPKLRSLNVSSGVFSVV